MTRVPNLPSRPLDGLTRRNFLTTSGVIGAAAALAGIGQVTFADLARAAETNPLPAGTPIVVLVTLYGGNDSLNTLIPYTDSAYYANRPQMGWQPADVLKLDDQFGLNPGMTGIAGLFKQGKVAIARGVGYPNPDHSHFRSMDIWQTANPATPIRTGWIGRYLDAAPGDSVQALHIGAIPPVLGAGASRQMASLNPAVRSTVPATDPLHGLGLPDPTDTPAEAAVAASYAAAENTQRQLASVMSTVPVADVSSDLSKAMDVVAACIKANVPTRVYSTSLGGFDTHATEKNAQRTLLAKVDAAVTNLRTKLAGNAHASDVVVMVYSEFGRRVRANGSQGTDHGTAGNVFLIGDKVSGGFKSEHPSLTNLDNGDLKYTTDFRSIYSEILTKSLQTDPGRVIPGGTFAPLGMLA